MNNKESVLRTAKFKSFSESTRNALATRYDNKGKHYAEYADGLAQIKSIMLGNSAVVLYGTFKDYCAVITRDCKKDKHGNYRALLTIQNLYSESDNLHTLHDERKKAIEDKYKKAILPIWKRNKMTFNDVIADFAKDSNCKHCGSITATKDELTKYDLLPKDEKTFIVDNVEYRNIIEKVVYFSNAQLCALWCAIADTESTITDDESKKSYLDYQNMIATDFDNVRVILQTVSDNNDIVAEYRKATAIANLGL
jgi:hypothetical protein